MSIISEGSLYGSAGKLLTDIGITGHFKLEPLPGGRNNRVFRVVTSERPFFLKSYFYSADDPRDRLHHEYGFTSFLWSCGIRSVPQPLGDLPERRVALYEYIEGKPASHRPSTTEDIEQAALFILSINSHRNDDAARKLPPASEAFFSLKGHVEGTRGRVERLSDIDVADDYDKSATENVQKELLPLWREIEDRIDSAIRKDDMVNWTLCNEDRWISPSDFGFHNAIEEENGEIRFIDFEYAGWDDPAKLLCDFTNQPDRILDSEISGGFMETIIANDVRPDFLRYRHSFLEPLYQIKWACIILNDFLPFGKTRREFTLLDDTSWKRSQLKKLDIMLDRVKSSLSSSVISRFK